MRITRILPRLLLCIALAFNGVAATVAVADSQPTCHSQDDTSQSTHHAGSDCCQQDGGGCHCAHACAIATLGETQTVNSAAVGVMHSLSSGHRPPALPEPIRPPIG